MDIGSIYYSLVSRSYEIEYYENCDMFNLPWKATRFLLCQGEGGNERKKKTSRSADRGFGNLIQFRCCPCFFFSPNKKCSKRLWIACVGKMNVKRYKYMFSWFLATNKLTAIRKKVNNHRNA